MTDRKRSAISGKFVTTEHAAAHPDTTVSERRAPTRHESPDVAELRRLLDAEREELHSPTRRLDAYYYSFNETGSVPIDAILSAVAIAGKSCHNTDMWTEDDEWSRWGVGRSLVDVIQCAAYEAAAALLGAATELAHMTEARDNARAEVERLTGRIEAAKQIGLGTHLGRPWADVINDMLRALDGKDL